MQSRNPRTMRDMTILGGWLFADLMLALMVIFLAAQSPFPKIPLTPTPTAIPTLTPTPTPVPRLELNFHEFRMDNADYNGILSNNASAVRAVENFINSQAVLHGRSAGLVIVYDGAPDDPDITSAQSIAQAVINNVLKAMGKQGPLFQRASYYDPLYLLDQSHSTVVLDIYLFKQ
jgi:hypothetical protein